VTATIDTIAWIRLNNGKILKTRSHGKGGQGGHHVPRRPVR
jgi:hypothetical protein